MGARNQMHIYEFYTFIHGETGVLATGLSKKLKRYGVG
jgi:hypothetical protein